MTAPAGWRYHPTVCEGGDVSINGMSPREQERKPERDRLEVPHPSYPQQRHPLWVYSLPVGERFAAGELSKGVWSS